MSRMIHENLIRLLWQNQILKSGPLATVSGMPIRVISPGIPSSEEGPDFRHARIVFGDERPCRGDVEVHVYSSDWDHHRHALDPRYEQLILHVVYRNDSRRSFVVSPARLSVPTVALERYLPRPLEEIALGFEGQDLPESDLARFCPRSGEFPSRPLLLARLRQMGVERFQQKIRRLQLLGKGVSQEDLLYRAIFEGLGYVATRVQMLELAMAIPLFELKNLLAEAPSSQAGILLRIELLERAGFQEEALASRDLLDPHGMRVLKRHPSGNVLSSDAWKGLRMRPGHRPPLRLQGLAELVRKIGQDSWVEKFSSPFVPCPREERELKRALAEISSLLKVDSEEGVLIGSGFAKILSLNAVLPGLLATQPSRNRLARCLWQALDIHPGLPRNKITRLVESRFLPEGLRGVQGLGLIHLGMIHLMKTACQSARMRCEECPVLGKK